MARKLSLEEIAERKILTPGQDYLLGYLKRAHPSSPIGMYEHKSLTDTCKEKIEMLNRETSLKWDAHQAIKAPYFQRKPAKGEQADKDDECFLYCFVTPEVEGYLIDQNGASGLRLVKARTLPDYMESGTCTPFIAAEDVSRAAGRVQRVYVHHEPKLDHTLVDVSVGGKGEDAHKISVWMPFGRLRKLLEWNLGDVVIPYKLQYREVPVIESKSFKPEVDGVKVYGK